MIKQFSYRPAVILLAEDNPADQMLTSRALNDARVKNKLIVVENGEEALDYLKNRNSYTDTKKYPKPDLFLLDINMPKVDGKMVLQEVKNDPELRLIPVIMLTTSSRERDILDSYNLGVNAYITKPVDIAQFQKIINELEYFWLVMAKLPTTLSKKFNSDNDEDYDFTNYDI